MPAGLSPMRLIFNSAFEWIWRARRHVRSRLVLRLVTIGAFDRKDALPVGAAPQTKESVRPTIIALERCITRRVTIHAAWMHEDSVGLQKSCARFGVILYFNRLCPNINKETDGDTRQKHCCK